MVGWIWPVRHTVLTFALKHPADVYLHVPGAPLISIHNPLAVTEGLGKETDICSLYMLNKGSLHQLSFGSLV